MPVCSVHRADLCDPAIRSLTRNVRCESEPANAVATCSGGRTAPATGIAEIDVVGRASPDQTTTTADPGSDGMTLAVTAGAVTAGAKFPGRGCVARLVGGV